MQIQTPINEFKLLLTKRMKRLTDWFVQAGSTYCYCYCSNVTKQEYKASRKVME